MTTIAALIPRMRRNGTGRIVAIRCASCRTWRKLRHFDRLENTCPDCVYGAARKRVLARHIGRR